MIKNIGHLKEMKNPVVIFGAGIAGKLMLDFCDTNGIFVECFCDNQIKDTRTVHGKIVYSVKTLEKMNKDFTFIITIVDIEFIIRQLKQSGFLNWVSIYDIYHMDLLDQNNFLLYHKMENLWYSHRNYILNDALYVNSVDLVITEKCSLKCNECSNLMQYYKNPISYEFDEIKLQVEKMLQCFKEIYEIRVIGGEPFVHPQINQILTFLLGNKKIKTISIWTNGTIVPKYNTIEIMRSKNIWLSVSDYGVLSKNIVALKNEFLNNHINFILKKVEYWSKCAEIEKHNRTMIEMKKIYDNCCVRRHLTLLKGKLYNCPFSANARNLGAIPINKTDFLDFFEENQDELKICSFLEQDHVFMSCDYCLGRPVLLKDTEKIVPYEQIKKTRKFDGIS